MIIFFCLLSLILMLLKNLKSQLMKSTFIFQAQMGSFLHDVVAVRKTFPEPPKENPAAADAKKKNVEKAKKNPFRSEFAVWR